MNAYQMYSEMLFAKADAQGIALSGTFELTSRCNLDCKMCYIHNRENDRAVKQREWTTSQWLELAEACRDAGMLNLLLTGGEPLIRADFKKIYTKCKELGLLVSVNSNGTLIDRDMVTFFRENPPTRMNITLYGASSATYEALCGDGAVYERVVWAIRALQKAGILVKLNFSSTPYNQQDAQAVYDFAKAHDLPIQEATYMFPPVRACENGCVETERFTPEESAAAHILWEKSRFTEEEWKDRVQKMLAGIKVPDSEQECQELPTERIRCRAGSSTCWVTWDGYLRPCGMMTVPSIEIAEAGFEEAWSRLREARKTIYIPSKCAKCEIAHVCDQCAAVCYAETGSFTEAPEYMCERTEAIFKMLKESE